MQAVDAFDMIVTKSLVIAVAQVLIFSSEVGVASAIDVVLDAVLLAERLLPPDLQPIVQKQLRFLDIGNMNCPVIFIFIFLRIFSEIM